MKMKNTYYIIFAIGFMFCLNVIFSGLIKAEYCENITKSKLGYNIFGNVVMIETLHASGYSSALTGQVTSKWLTTDRCYFPNNIIEERTWVSSVSNGQYANGSFKVVLGVNSPWGIVNLSQKTYYLSILF